MLKNYMEDFVDNTLPRVLERYKDICKCEKCIMDIKAKCLNQLRPLYFVTERGDVYSKLNSLEAQFKTDIVMELVKAIDTVSKSPRHD